MSTFVFVHGAWHGAWCWYKVVSRLQRQGQTVFAPDLASLGRDRTPLAEVSLAGWAESICKIVDAAAEPVVLIGHSRGGIVISEVAERRPRKVAALVYLTAFLLRDGEALLPVAQSDDTGLVLPNLIVASDQSYTTVNEEAVRAVFYGESPDEDVVLAKALLAPEALAPSVTPIHITEANFGRVPRIYIECLRDRAIPLALQRRMHTGVPCEKVVSLDTDHSPFFSMPDVLIEQLISLTATGV